MMYDGGHIEIATRENPSNYLDAYSKIRGEGKYLYIFHGSQDYDFLVALKKKQRKSDKRGEILDIDDVHDLYKTAPLSSRIMSIIFPDILKKYHITLCRPEDLEKIGSDRLEVIADFGIAAALLDFN